MTISTNQRNKAISLLMELHGVDIAQSALFPRKTMANALARKASDDQTKHIVAELRRLVALSDKEFRSEEFNTLMELDAYKSKTRSYHFQSSYADESYWSKMPYWSIDEGIILLTGRDPKKVTFDSLKSQTRISYYAKYTFEQRELALRAVGLKQLGRTNLPVVFLRWAKELDLLIYESLLVAVEEFSGTVFTTAAMLEKAQATLKQQEKLIAEISGQNAESSETIAKQVEKIAELETRSSNTPTVRTGNLEQAAKANKRPDARTLATLEKMILVMAADGYGYRPNAKKSTITKDIVDAAASYAIQISDETVRSTLKRCAKHWSDENESK